MSVAILVQVLQHLAIPLLRGVYSAVEPPILRMAFYSDAYVELALASVAPAVEGTLQKYVLDGEKHTAWDHLTNEFQKYPQTRVGGGGVG